LTVVGSVWDLALAVYADETALFFQPHDIVLVIFDVLGASKFGQKLPPMGPRIDHKEAEGELSIPQNI
jgi:hypothetical protein